MRVAPRDHVHQPLGQIAVLLGVHGVVQWEYHAPATRRMRRVHHGFEAQCLDPLLQVRGWVIHVEGQQRPGLHVLGGPPASGVPADPAAQRSLDLGLGGVGHGQPLVHCLGSRVVRHQALRHLRPRQLLRDPSRTGVHPVGHPDPFRGVHRPAGRDVGVAPNFSIHLRLLSSLDFEWCPL